MNDNKQTFRGIVTKISRGNKLSFTVRFTDDAWKDKEGKPVYNHKYINCFAGGKYADVLQKNLYKGRHVVVIGKVSASGYVNKEGKAQGVLNLNDIEVIYVDERIARQTENILEVLEAANLSKDGTFSFTKEEAVNAVESFVDQNKAEVKEEVEDTIDDLSDAPF